jgi:surface antigen
MEPFIRTRHNHGEGFSRTHRTAKAPQVAMRRGVSAGLGLLIALACGVMPMRVAALNPTFLGNTPLNFFQPDDFALMKKTAEQVLESAQSNAKQSWSNPKTGASGFAQVTGQFTTADGTQCKRVRIFNKAGGLESVATYPVCKYSDRGWVINADAKPAK